MFNNNGCYNFVAACTTITKMHHETKLYPV